MSIIQLNLFILNICDLIYRIPHSISDQHQRHTTADSEYGHKETLFITHQIPDRGFPCKTHTFPDESYSFQKYSPPFFWCRRPHQHCRFRCKFLIAGCKRCSHSTCDRGSGCHHSITHVVWYVYLRNMRIHDLICIDNNVRKDFLSHQYSKDTSSCRCKECIPQIFRCNGKIPVSQSLHSSYLYSLFLYHTCHTGQTNQCRNKEKHNRKYFSDRTHTIRIFSESIIFYQCTSIIYIPFWILDLTDLLTGISKLFLAFCNFCFRCLLSVFIFFSGIGKFCFIFRNFCLSFFQRLLLCFQFCFPCI